MFDQLDTVLRVAEEHDEEFKHEHLDLIAGIYRNSRSPNLRRLVKEESEKIGIHLLRTDEVAEELADEFRYLASVKIFYKRLSGEDLTDSAALTKEVWSEIANKEVWHDFEAAD